MNDVNGQVSKLMGQILAPYQPFNPRSNPDRDTTDHLKKMILEASPTPCPAIVQHYVQHCMPIGYYHGGPVVFLPPLSIASSSSLNEGLMMIATSPDENEELFHYFWDLETLRLYQVRETYEDEPRQEIMADIRQTWENLPAFLHWALKPQA